MTVSPATPYDLGDLKTLMQALLMREHAAYLARPVGVAEAVSVTAQIVGSAWPAMLIARVADRAVGFAWAENAHLQALYLAPAHRGTGLGAALLAETLDRSRADGARRLTVDTHRANRRAQAFYTRHGFRPSAPWIDPSWGVPLPMQRFERAVG